MATYSNNNEKDVIWIPSEFKIIVHMDEIGGYHMEDVDFSCTFVCGGKTVKLLKEEMIQADADNYIAALDSKKFGKGYLSIVYKADIPDDDLPDGFRHETVVVCTKFQIK